MSSKLDQSLEEIQSASRKSAGRRRNAPRASRPAAAPVGGITKSTKPARGAGKATPAAKAGPVSGDSKIIVSGLPKDVTESQIKEYFVQSVGHIKRVDLVYGPNSQSRGIANITFGKPDGASKAFQKLNGLLVDNRPIKIEIVVGAAQADKVLPTVKSLADRATQPKSQPKPAVANRKAPAGKGAPAKAGPAKGGKKRGKNVRPAKKTAEELDAEMGDYFNANSASTETAAAPAAAGNGDAAMQDEIM
ncbi:hypothetical protein NLU13_3500 [Sarocladium strictum]|uniref:RRM domain-containing protein n=1 Tax=Sarocladium strictum TaxID=5046 RepID=A0AA39LAB2_SARSR|nr:hypothetical protein NLU13_3500 [Sarocladium strictum]